MIFSYNNEMEKKVPLPNESGWTMYGANWCPFCKKALLFFKYYRIQCVYYNVDALGGDKHIKEQLKHLTNNQKTIPIIFKGRKFIGGYSDLRGQRIN